MTSSHLVHRPRRLRRSATVRHMVQETSLGVHHLIAPLFIHETLKKSRPIASMPGHMQLCLNEVSHAVEALAEVGIGAVLLFGIPAEKDAEGSGSLREDGVIQQAIRRIRESHPDMLIITDVCFCEYTDHGHCGMLKGEHLDNDATLSALARQAVSHADAGADWVAPSSMTDGMVGAIRSALDAAGHTEVAILSYSVKYCSSLYGPFREAAEGAPQFGDRKTIQMNPANAMEALREAALDVEEGADLLMVKPAMLYMDVICRIKQHYPEIPLCAYQVSGEFAMIKAAADRGMLAETEVMMESLYSLRRAGADLIITYFARDAAIFLRTTTS
ncbi:delta-aminolevulinic acid dehydratases (porphobilinogen synthase) [Legionella geestiana]|uniref:Delta-aminolevulinic acid dehydratase n=1 Tax=Legionella geestiana TaxID=45065 RepID=A0A0W0TXK1_9GAMM|nr:porphobilinogen synthase [Legionella geestiana]KTD00135.1 delta-aminolevulinic acid dehydratases (porphobilinogen synthase) [Legionella geestiana]QBS11820.1 porphobilinogen synthase [Legionella geestiana]QDQ40565.1 porphobilinogen synthase [Legionella geestiana]STX53486.1 delta-aminolevulinic acid dehydratases (porphobilinogen synthase) [Legionella geestiana]